jgi:hypothetical protein
MAEKPSPLLILSARFMSIGLPSLSALIAKLGSVEEYHEFIELIREYLPEYEAEILREPPQAGQVAKFCNRFQDRYFPLAYYYRHGYIDEEIRYYDLLVSIPVVVSGLSWEDYDSIASGSDPGIQLITYLLENPYQEDGQRVSLAEACEPHVGRELLMRVPEGGIEITRVHKLFDKSKYKPIALWCDWICQDTGNFFLDTDIETLNYNYPYPEWDKERVETLTRQWHEAELINEEVNNFAEWLEKDPPAHFQEILDFIEGRR